MKKEIDPIRKIKLENRLIGYHQHYKSRFILIRDKILTNSEFILWDYCFSALTDWDSRHFGYATFDFTNAEIATSLNWEVSTVSKNMHSLMEKRFITRVGKHRKVTNWILLNKPAKESKLVTPSLTHYRQELSPEEKDNNQAEDINNLDIDEIIHNLEMEEYLKDPDNKSKTPFSKPP